jgi:hypothetical protein
LPPVRRPCFPNDTENGAVGSAGIPRLHLFPEIPEQMVAVHVGSENVWRQERHNRTYVVEPQERRIIEEID